MSVNRIHLATLDESGQIPSAQLPAFVDDVVEVANFAALPATGVAGKIYVTIDNGKTWRWGGSAYAEISASLALGETSSTAYRGDRGKTAYDHSQVTSGNPHVVTKADVGLGSVDNVQQQPFDADLTAIAGLDSTTAGALATDGAGWIRKTYAQLKTALGVTKADLGLGSVDNTPDSGKPVSTAQQAALDAKADLVGGTVPSAQLPSFVDDVLEYANFAALPGTGTTGKIYVTLDDNKTYRWSGSAYVVISDTLALGETSSTAYRGDRGKTAYDHSQLTSGNPHSVTKAEVGLGSVDNTADSAKPISTATQAALDNKAPTDGVVAMVGAATGVAATDSANIQAVLDSGAKVVSLGTSGTYKGAVTVPAGVRFTSAGASMGPGPSATQRYIVATAGDGVTVDGIAFDFSSDSGLLGQENAIRIQHNQATVSNCKFTGNGFRYGVLIQAASALSDITVRDSQFDTTSYGVLQQTTDVSNIEIKDNRFKHVRRGDAIELNLSATTQFEITGNRIDDVTANSVVNAGIGIGIAGAGGYGGALTGQPRRGRISGNFVSNCELDLIHLEVANNVLVDHNTVWQEGALINTASGILASGCAYSTITDNEVRDCANGVNAQSGVVSSNYVVSSTNELIARNRVYGGTRGIRSLIAGENTSVRIEKNLVDGATIGIHHRGATAAYVKDNVVQDCATSTYEFDMNYAGSAPINAVYSNILFLEGNAALRKGLPAPRTITVTDVNAGFVVERGNNFTVGKPSTDDRDYHVPGDIVFDTATSAVKVCTTPGWLKGSATAFTFTAVATNDFITVDTGGNPSPTFKVGQRISLAGAGAAAATLSTVIRRIYSTSGTYYMMLSDTVSTTVASSTAIALEQTATYIGTSGTPDVQVFAADGTWTKPTGRVTTTAVLVGGGGGGGSGRRGAAASVRCGGGGGAGAPRLEVALPTSTLPSTAAVTIGLGGAGGAAVTANDTNGAAGSNGGTTSVGTNLLRCPGGTGGAGGTTSTGTGGTSTGGTTAGTGGGSASATGGAGGTPNIAGVSAGGGAGGGITAADSASNGGAGGIAGSVGFVAAAAGVVDTTVPGNGTSRTADSGLPGSGGGGGAGSITTTAQTGGNGGTYGGGAGGGGASLNGNNSGAGGAGANGIVIMIST